MNRRSEELNRLIVWPDCPDCEGRGWTQYRPDSFPTECASCKGARKNAIAVAQAKLRKIKAGKHV